MQKIFWIVITFLAGAVLPLQAGINNRLAKGLSSPVYATLVSFAVGTATLLVYALVSGQTYTTRTLKSLPAYSWTGGVLGCFYLATVILAFPRLGAALTFSLIVAGQLLISLLLDHYGILVAQPHGVNVYRLLGVLLIVAGVVLIRKF